MVTHDRDEAYQLCDTLLLLSKGHVIAAGKRRISSMIRAALRPQG